MKIALYGKKSDAVEKILREKGVALVRHESNDFDLLISYGGDGAMLGSELVHPGRLKMPVRDRETAPYCPKHSLEWQIDALLGGKLKETSLMKLVGTVGVVQHYAINDIFIHNTNNVSALRYQVKIDDDIYAREVVGDGVGVATVHGSTAYYRSITHGSFRVGIGIAFSNSTELLNHLVLQEDSVIKVRILRGPSELVFDNSPDITPLREGDVITIRKSDKTAQVLGLDVFMCPECRRIRREQRAIGLGDTLL
ncbi:MAG: inorganic polyphosphate/ATP-NAD kinase [Lentisphaerae bacterium ADurb.Bin242]|nr:MAG: inorganic polyphosphate/ATP-NAD kinase [Lentisphaerae bacterium ADurb.Bin242]